LSRFKYKNFEGFQATRPSQMFQRGYKIICDHVKEYRKADCFVVINVSFVKFQAELQII